jgi:hypothetical protein
VDEERKLRQLIEERRSLDEISSVMGRTRVSVKSKMFNLGLKLACATTGVGGTVAVAAVAPTTSSMLPTSYSVALKLPEQLPSIEEELKILTAAVEGLRQPGLSRTEQSRLHYIIMGVKVYQELFAAYVNYKGLEDEVLELRRQLAAEKDKSTKN